MKYLMLLLLLLSLSSVNVFAGEICKTVGNKQVCVSRIIAVDAEMALENPTVILKKYWLMAPEGNETIQRHFKPNEAAAEMICSAFGMSSSSRWFKALSVGSWESFNAKDGMVTQYNPLFSGSIKILDTVMCN